MQDDHEQNSSDRRIASKVRGLAASRYKFAYDKELKIIAH